MRKESFFSCALSGHRDLPETFSDRLLFEKLQELVFSGCNAFYCGMAEGFDLRALDCLLRLKESHSISIEACIPFPGQERRFRETERAFYREALLRCDRKKIFFPEYRAGCFHARNRYMVDSADLLFAYCTKRSGGTFYTVEYAKKTGKKVLLWEG